MPCGVSKKPRQATDRGSSEAARGGLNTLIHDLGAQATPFDYGSMKPEQKATASEGHSSS